MMRTSRRLPAIVVLCLMCPLAHADAQSVSAAEKEALGRLRVDRGGRADEIEPALRVADEAGAKGLPVAPLVSKIREGLAKNADPARIQAVVRQMATHLETADGLLREVPPAGGVDRVAALVLLADALGGGVTAAEVGDIRTLAARAATAPLTADALAGAAKGLAFIKAAQLPAGEGAALMAEAARQGYRSHEMADVGREIKRRERDYRESRASLGAVRDAIARGTRPEQLFREGRAATTERPEAGRPESTTSRPEPAVRPERPAPPERPQRPERPERPTKREE
jgi:hypothetical protein